MRKYRIVAETNKRGVTFYTPQYKDLLFWKNWLKGVAIDTFCNISFNTYGEALSYIHRDIENEKEKKDREIIVRNYIYV